MFDRFRAALQASLRATASPISEAPPGIFISLQRHRIEVASPAGDPWRDPPWRERSDR